MSVQQIAQLPTNKLKELRDNTALPYRVRRAASNLLDARQADIIRAGYQR